jgi:hypothetical protein
MARCAKAILCDRYFSRRCSKRLKHSVDGEEGRKEAGRAGGVVAVNSGRHVSHLLVWEYVWER